MKKALAIFALVFLLAILPQFAGKYLLYMTIHIMLLSLFSLGFNLLFGYTGLLSFGQAGFYAVGAYACAKILLAVPSLLAGIIGGVAMAGGGRIFTGHSLHPAHADLFFHAYPQLWDDDLFPGLEMAGYDRRR